MAAEGVLEILAAGDVLLGGRMLEAPQAGELFGPLTRRRLEQADIFLWNCEIAGLSSVSKQNTFVFHADGLLFPQMAFANGAACTANNHVFDGLEEGAANLMAVLEGARIRHNGLHDRGTFAPLSLLPQREPPVYLLTGSPMSQIGSGPRIVTLSYPQLLEAVRTLRAREPEACIILYSHDGNEGFSEASDRQRLWADWFAAAGADIILFAHSHCYGGFETLEVGTGEFFVRRQPRLAEPERCAPAVHPSRYGHRRQIRLLAVREDQKLAVFPVPHGRKRAAAGAGSGG